jgi:hypothetical protein
MDELKKFLREHEAGMYVEVPDERGLWKRIEGERQKKNPRRRVVMLTMRFAAAACTLLLIGLGIRLFITEDVKPVEPKEIAHISVPIKDSVQIKDSVSYIEETLVRRVEEKKVKKYTIRLQPKERTQPMTKDYYPRLVSYQMERLRNTPVYAESPDYFKPFKQQLQQIDSDENLLRKDIQVYGLNDQLLEALITVYQRKLSLLKSLRSEVNKMNKWMKEKRTARQQPYYLDL